MLVTSEGRRGRGREGRVTKDEDEMQMISNGIAVLHSLFLHSSTPHLIPPSTLLLPEAHHNHHQKSLSPLSLCLSVSLSLCVQKEAPNLLLTGYAGNWMIPKNKEDPCFSLSIKEAKSLATKIPGNFSIENPSSGLGASSNNRISCHKFPGNFSLLGISSSGLGGASSNIYLSCHKFQQTLLWNPYAKKS
jgi:hypothetical protein